MPAQDRSRRGKCSFASLVRAENAVPGVEQTLAVGYRQPTKKRPARGIPTNTPQDGSSIGQSGQMSNGTQSKDAPAFESARRALSSGNKVSSEEIGVFARVWVATNRLSLYNNRAISRGESWVGEEAGFPRRREMQWLFSRSSN